MPLRAAWSHPALGLAWAALGTVLVAGAALLGAMPLQEPAAWFVFVPAACGLVLALALGYGWGAAPVWAAHAAWALAAGVPAGWAVGGALGMPLGLGVLVLAFRAAPVPIAPRALRAAVFFVLAGFVAALVGSMGALVWSWGEGANAASTLARWQGWWGGLFVVPVGLGGLALAIMSPAWARWKHRRGLAEPERTPPAPLSLTVALASVAIVLLAYVAVLQRVELIAVDRAAALLSDAARAEVDGAFRAFSIVQWVTFALLGASGFLAYQVARGWQHTAASLEATNEALRLEISVRERAEAELAQTAERLQAANDTKQTLLSVISHDLRGPVGTTLALARLADEEADGLSAEEHRDLAREIGHVAGRASDLLDTLLAWSLVQADGLVAKAIPTPLGDLVADRASLVALRAERKGVRVETHVPEGLVVETDPEMLGTVLYNLVGNAVKFTPAAGTVTVRAVRDGSRVALEVSDTGTGMSAADLERALDPGVRFTQPGTDGEPGTGMGLALCAELVEALGGTLEAETAPSEGTSFRFVVAGAVRTAPAPVVA